MFKEKKRENKSRQGKSTFHGFYVAGKDYDWGGRRRSFSAIEGYQRSRSYDSAGTSHLHNEKI